MSSGYGRHARVLRTLRFIEKNQGVTMDQLLEINGRFSERTVYRDITVMRIAGENVVCRDGLFFLDPGVPDQNLKLPVKPPKVKKTPYIAWSNFRKWYKPDVRGDDWHVVRADKKDDKGQVVGRVMASPTKNFYLKALAIAEERNEKILDKRAKTRQLLLASGWTEQMIAAKIAEIQESVRQEMGPDYREEI